ncbi:MAG TPA: hypothetical protein VHA07_10945 [Devosia sp.]|nr:hypothetical protein [Devosia sp.]
MAKDKGQDKGAPPGGSIEATLLSLARPKMTPKELLKAARKAHPEASKKDIIRAAFHSIITVADSDVDKAVILQNFALQERAVDDV